MKTNKSKELNWVGGLPHSEMDEFLANDDHFFNMVDRARLMKRTKEVNKEATISLVKAAQGNRSMRQFAEALSVNVSSISRILNGTTTEISPYLMANIIDKAVPGSGVTFDQLVKAQGLTVTEAREPIGKRQEWISRSIITNELLLRGHSVRQDGRVYVSLGKHSFYPDYVIRTDAFPGNKDNWYFIDKLSKKVKAYSVSMIDSWLNLIMSLYYQGMRAKRVSLVVDDENLFAGMKMWMERYEIKDEISVILVSMETGKVLDEYVAPLTDGRVPKLVLTGEIKEVKEND